MFYAARGNVPPKRHTQHRAPDGSLYAEELFGVEGFTGRSSLLYHLVAADADAQDRAGRPRSRSRRPTTASTATGWSRPAASAARRRRHGPRAAVLQQRRGDGRRPAGRGDAGRHLLPQRRGRRDALRPRGQRASRHELRRRCATARATTSCSRSARPGGSIRTRASDQRMLYLESPSEIVPPQALPQRLRPAARALAVLAARHPRCPTRSRPRATSRRLPRLRPRRAAGITAYHYRAPPVRRRRLGRLPLPVHLQHRRLRADHRARPPAAAGPPDVPGAQLRRLLVRAAQVRLPPARDPGAVQPLEHQQRRGHLLRRRQLHEPPRRGDRVVHAPSGGHPARAAPGHGRGVDRQGGDRGAGGHGRHVPPALAHAGRRPTSRTTAIRIRGCRPRTPAGRGARARASADRRRSPTDGRRSGTGWRQPLIPD